MKASKILAAVLAASIAVVLTGSAANAAPKPAKFKNCTALNKAYPTGVAQSKAAADVAVAGGSARPAVSAGTYALNKGMDRDKDLVACEQTAAAAPAPATPVAPKLTYTKTGIPLFDSLNQARVDRNEITQIQSSALTRIGASVVSPRINTRETACPYWDWSTFRTSFLDSAFPPDVLTALGLTTADAEWAKTNMSDAIVSYCVAIGAMSAQ